MTFDQLCKGEVVHYVCDSYCLVDDITSADTLETAKGKIVNKIDQVLPEIGTIDKFYIGKTYVKKKKKKTFKPLEPSSWKKTGVIDRWKKHKGTDHGRDGMIVIAVITKEKVAATAKDGDNQELYTLALEQKLLQHYTGDTRLSNKTFGSGSYGGNKYIGPVLYITFALKRTPPAAGGLEGSTNSGDTPQEIENPIDDKTKEQPCPYYAVCDREYLVEITRKDTLETAEKKLVEHINKRFLGIERKRCVKIKKFHIGKIYVPAKDKNLDPLNPDTWKKEGIDSIWSDHKDRMIVITVITKTQVPLTQEGKRVVHQEQYTLALEQRLLHYYKITKRDKRLDNDTFTPDNPDKKLSAGFALYVTFSCVENTPAKEEEVEKNNDKLPFPGQPLEDPTANKNH